MPIRESRLKSGLLTIAGMAFASQATNVNLEPSTDEEGDPIEVLSGDQIGADEVTSWVMNITAVQDFDDPDGFIAYALLNSGDEVPFTWRPNATGVSFAGTVKVRALPIGGDVNARLTTEASWPLVGAPTPTWPNASTNPAAFGEGVFGEGVMGA